MNGELIESVTAILADCIRDEGFDLALAGVPIEYGDPLTNVAKHCAETLFQDGFLNGGGAETIEMQRRIIVELRPGAPDCTCGHTHVWHDTSGRCAFHCGNPERCPCTAFEAAS